MLYIYMYINTTWKGWVSVWRGKIYIYIHMLYIYMYIHTTWKGWVSVWREKKIYIYICYTYICVHTTWKGWVSVWRKKTKKGSRHLHFLHLGHLPLRTVAKHVKKKYLDLKRDLQKRPINMEGTLYYRGLLKRARDTFISSTLGICPCAPSRNMFKKNNLSLKREIQNRPINMERTLCITEAC